MADDQNQRPYRSNESLTRRAPAANPASGSDPLAELARLIGQTDPFAEFGRENARRATAPPPPPAAAPPVRNFGADEYFGATTVPAAPPVAMELPIPPPPSRPRQPYAAGNLYPPPAEPPRHPADETGGYAADPYHPSNAHLGDEEEGYYDDEAPSKKRSAIVAVAVVVGLAVIGTASAFGYRALFGPARYSSPPPVIKADTAPSKIVPAAASKTPNKLITDRVTDRAQDEKLVSREEKPVEIRSNPGAPQAQANPPLMPAQTASGNGVVTGEPKRVHTIAIRPDQLGMGDAQPPTTAMQAPVPVNQPSAPPAHVASGGPAVANPPEPQPRPAEPRAARPERHTTASVSTNAPLSLNPNAPTARAPVRTAAVAAPSRNAPEAQTPRTGGYAVQVSSQRSEAEARAAFRSLQAKYPGQLGNRQASIRKVELGAKGTYYRAMVGPFANAGEASTLCNGLRAAGAQCLIQRN